ncbi:unnamed protein product [Lymnaea stagnalis]|uniref:Uncharacterized protein n=1 Tax=Lymnaea stagnalis TaxID=6523 RepID=A0AAV2HD26_LYMST
MVLLPYRSPSPILYFWDCSFISFVVISISLLSDADQKCQNNWKTPTHQFIVYNEKHQAVKSACPLELDIGKPYLFKVCLSETLSPRSNFTIDIYQQSYNFHYIYAPCYEFNYTIPAHHFNVSIVSSSDCFKYLETTCYVFASIVWRRPPKQR